MLESIWFILWGVLWAVYFMLDGFDLGIGTLMPFLAGNEADKQMFYGAMGPYWDGNEVWLIAAGGVTFAAFPTAYAVMFSGLYSALMLVLFALIFRGVAIEYRNKVNDPTWKRTWDCCLVAGSFIPALLLGVAFANIFKGIPIDAEGVYQGTLLTLLNPYGILGGVLFVAMFLLHGSLWLLVKASGPVHERAAAVVNRFWVALAVVLVGFLIATWFATSLFDNYIQGPLMAGVPIILIPVIVVGALIMVRVCLGKKRWWSAWFASSALIVGVTLFGVAGLYPNLLPSSLDPTFSITIHNSASSQLTLKIMLAVALTFVPVVIAYQAWAYNLFKEPIKEGGADQAYH